MKMIEVKLKKGDPIKVSENMRDYYLKHGYTVVGESKKQVKSTKTRYKL